MTSTTRTWPLAKQSPILHRLGDAPDISLPATRSEPGSPPADANATSLAARSTLTLQNVDLVESGSSAVYSRDHEPVGTVEQIFGGPDSRAPEWVTVAASRGDDGAVLVPLAGAWLDAGDVIIAYTADQLGDAPTLRAEADLTPADTTRALVHYAHADQDPAHA